MSTDSIRDAIADALHASRFFVRHGQLSVMHNPAESWAWELYLGQLLGESQTRCRRTFETWKLSCQRPGSTQRQACDAGQSGQSAIPLLSILLDPVGGTLFVVRFLRILAAEPYESQPNVIETRTAPRWQPELVGSVMPGSGGSAALTAAALRQLVFQALVGASRLPVTSLQSPLPAFSLGQIAYRPAGPIRSDQLGFNDIGELLRWAVSPELNLVQRAKALESALRATAAHDIPPLADELLSLYTGQAAAADLPRLAAALFHHVALNPFTGFGEQFVALLGALAHDRRLGIAAVMRPVSLILRQLCRHLTAFDLETFHHRGADYPDALLLDGLLALYLQLAAAQPGVLLPSPLDDSLAAGCKRRLRRALRQAWLIREHYRGLRVPDRPTSLGDNQRVLEHLPPVPQEQILDRTKRRKRLYGNEPLPRQLLAAVAPMLHQSLADLAHPDELRELGMALFLDRPLSLGKAPGEIDRTPLLAYEAYSRIIAQRRLQTLRRLADEVAELLSRGQTGAGILEPQARYFETLKQLAVPGVSVSHLPGVRNQVVCLEDAALAAPDFVFVRTTTTSLHDLLRDYFWQPLEVAAPQQARWLLEGTHVLLIRQPAPHAPSGQVLVAFDSQAKARLVLSPVEAPGSAIQYREHAGREHLAAGLDAACVPPCDGNQPPADPRTLIAGQIQSAIASHRVCCPPVICR
jgi:hypothetical protein